MREWTHAALVDRAVRWLLGTRKCAVAYGELATMEPCIPDAIGWTSTGSTVLVEVKVSRSDFHADRHKHHRRHAARSPGRERWYLTPGGLLTPDDLPERWGLLEVRGSRVFRVVPSGAHEVDEAMERRMLVAVARRHHLGIRYDAERGRFESYAEREKRAAEAAREARRRLKEAARA